MSISIGPTLMLNAQCSMLNAQCSMLNAQCEQAEAGQRLPSQPQRAGAKDRTIHCECCPAPGSLSLHRRGSSPQPELHRIPLGVTWARCPRLHPNSHTPSKTGSQRGPRFLAGARGRAPPASRLPACAAQAGATASLSPSDAARAGAGGARAPGPQRAARGLCCQSRGPGLSSRHLQRLRRPEVTVSEAARRCPVSMFSGWRSYAQ